MCRHSCTNGWFIVLIEHLWTLWFRVESVTHLIMHSKFPTRGAVNAQLKTWLSIIINIMFNQRNGRVRHYETDDWYFWLIKNLRNNKRRFGNIGVISENHLNYSGSNLLKMLRWLPKAKIKGVFSRSYCCYDNLLCQKKW